MQLASRPLHKSCADLRAHRCLLLAQGHATFSQLDVCTVDVISHVRTLLRRRGVDAKNHLLCLKSPIQKRSFRISEIYQVEERVPSQDGPL